jgi:hypothetical protein
VLDSLGHGGFSTPRSIVSITSQVIAGRPVPAIRGWFGMDIVWKGTARAARFIVARGIFLASRWT